MAGCMFPMGLFWAGSIKILGSAGSIYVTSEFCVLVYFPFLQIVLVFVPTVIQIYAVIAFTHMVFLKVLKITIVLL